MSKPVGAGAPLEQATVGGAGGRQVAGALVDAGVIVDIYYDYLLANHWGRYCGIPLAEWTREIYQMLDRRRMEMPPRLQKSLPYMIADNWLWRYSTIEGMRFTFSKVKNRVRRPDLFDGATDHLLYYLGPFEEEFNQFFPEVIQMVETECAKE